MAGTYLGIAEAAVDVAAERLGSRRHSHTGEVAVASEPGEGSVFTLRVPELEG